MQLKPGDIVAITSVAVKGYQIQSSHLTVNGPVPLAAAIDIQRQLETLKPGCRPVLVPVIR